MLNMYSFNFSKKDIAECIKINNTVLFNSGWEIFKVYNEDFIYAVKLRKKYDENEIPFNEDGYKYQQLFINLNITRHYLFFLKKGYNVDKIFE